MNTRSVTQAPSGDPIVSENGWRASFIVSPFTRGTFVLAAQSPDKRMFFGLTPGTGFLIEVHRKPDAAQVNAFLTDCMSGKIVSNTLDAIARSAAAS
jgi:hypothetical protein